VSEAIRTEECNEEYKEAGREVIDKHLESLADSGYKDGVNLFHQVTAQRSHDHGTEQHRGIRECGDDSHCCRCTDNAATDVADKLTAGVGDEQREEVDDHRIDHGREIFIREPADIDEHGWNEPPGDEGRDVRHDHTAQKRAERLYFAGDTAFLF